jgi:hypothetical protein
MHISVALIVAMAVLPACSSVPTAGSREILDEKSGNTLLVVTKPLVFTRERTDVAAHARDYATLVAVEIDISGKYNNYLLLYRWSTVDRRMSAPPDPHAGKLQILAEGRMIELTPITNPPIGLPERRELYVPKHGDFVTHTYQVDTATLRFIASSRTLIVRMPQEQLDMPFKVWEDGRAALVRFAAEAAAQ